MVSQCMLPFSWQPLCFDWCVFQSALGSSIILQGIVIAIGQSELRLMLIWYLDHLPICPRATLGVLRYPQVPSRQSRVSGLRQNFMFRTLMHLDSAYHEVLEKVRC